MFKRYTLFFYRKQHTIRFIVHYNATDLPARTWKVSLIQQFATPFKLCGVYGVHGASPPANGTQYNRVICSYC